MSAIAVVVTCHDLGRTVEEAVASLLAQTRPAAEVVVVDDGSTDAHTRRVLDSLRHPGVRVARTPNRGLAAARNHGVRLTRAPCLVMLNADDALEPAYLEQTAGRLDGDPTLDFVTTALRAFEGARYVWTPPPCTLVDTLARGAPHHASMFRRSVWEKVGGFDEAPPIGGCEDLDFWVSAMACGCRGAVIHEPLLRYRVRPDSMHHGAVERGTYVDAVASVLRKHRATIEQLGPALVLAKEAALGAQRQHRREVEGRCREAEAELAALRARVGRFDGSDRPGPGRGVRWGELRRLSPLSATWGLDRGLPVDRHYIEGFLGRHRADVRGVVLEVKDPGYTERYGGAAVTRCEVVDVDPANPRATIVADLRRAGGIPSGSADCVILTQTLHLLDDVRAALGHVHRVLKPGGVLLCSLPCVSRVDPESTGPGRGDFWRFTPASAESVFGEVFGREAVEVTAAGNLLACVAFLYGLAAEELSPEELAHTDPSFPLVVLVRAVKPG